MENTGGYDDNMAKLLCISIHERRGGRRGGEKRIGEEKTINRTFRVEKQQSRACHVRFCGGGIGSTSHRLVIMGINGGMSFRRASNDASRSGRKSDFQAP